MDYKLTDFHKLRKEKILNLKGSYYYIKLKITLCKWLIEDNKKDLFTIRQMEDILSIPKASVSRHLLTLNDELFLYKIGEGTHSKYFMNISKEEAQEVVSHYLEKRDSKKRDFLKNVGQSRQKFKPIW